MPGERQQPGVGRRPRGRRAGVQRGLGRHAQHQRREPPVAARGRASCAEQPLAGLARPVRRGTRIGGHRRVDRHHRDPLDAASSDLSEVLGPAAPAACPSGTRRRARRRSAGRRCARGATAMCAVELVALVEPSAHRQPGELQAVEDQQRVAACRCCVACAARLVDQRRTSPSTRPELRRRAAPAAPARSTSDASSPSCAGQLGRLAGQLAAAGRPSPGSTRRAARLSRRRSSRSVVAEPAGHRERLVAQRPPLLEGRAVVDLVGQARASPGSAAAPSSGGSRSRQSPERRDDLVVDLAVGAGLPQRAWWSSRVAAASCRSTSLEPRRPPRAPGPRSARRSIQLPASGEASASSHAARRSGPRRRRVGIVCAWPRRRAVSRSAASS